LSEVDSEKNPGKNGLLPQSVFVKNRHTLQIMGRIGAIFLVIAISVLIFLLRDQAHRLAVYGYPGVFLIAFMAYGTVILPAPGLAIIFTLAGVLNPILVAVFAGAGAAAGETIGYLAGYSGQAVLEKRTGYERIYFWMKKNAPATIFVLSVIPNPFFDLAGIAAGAFRIPVWKFLFYCWSGETVKMLFFALLGSYAFGFIDQLF
jgi:uncharacterized membrane protein YdjX (TVP38/TMEM64 family)